jgi:hypothetical protein
MIVFVSFSAKISNANSPSSSIAQLQQRRI